MKRKDLYKTIATSAASHGLESEPDHEVGDLQIAFRRALDYVPRRKLPKLARKLRADLIDAIEPEDPSQEAAPAGPPEEFLNIVAFINLPPSVSDRQAILDRLGPIIEKALRDSGALAALGVTLEEVSAPEWAQDPD